MIAEARIPPCRALPGGEYFQYVRQVLEAYRRTPGINGTVRPNDRLLAATLYDRGVPLTSVENALVLAGGRRIVRPPDAPPLRPVRSLHDVLPVIDKVLAVGSSQDYRQV